LREWAEHIAEIQYHLSEEPFDARKGFIQLVCEFLQPLTIFADSSGLIPCQWQPLTLNKWLCSRKTRGRARRRRRRGYNSKPVALFTSFKISHNYEKLTPSSELLAPKLNILQYVHL
jgi:hypothetical protein